MLLTGPCNHLSVLQLESSLHNENMSWSKAKILFKSIHDLVKQWTQKLYIQIFKK
jgi:hypothetical protein